MLATKWTRGYHAENAHLGEFPIFFFFFSTISLLRSQTSLLPVRLLASVFREIRIIFFPLSPGRNLDNQMASAAPAQPRLRINRPIDCRFTITKSTRNLTALPRSVSLNRTSRPPKKRIREYRAHTCLSLLFPPRNNRNRYNFSQRHGSRAIISAFLPDPGSRQLRRGDRNFSPLRMTLSLDFHRN